MLDSQKHKVHLSNILSSLYKNSLVASNLGFKGGTASYFFYKLPRFSVDLDFDLIQPNSITKPVSKMLVENISEILKKNYLIKDSSTKHNTLFWLLSYENGQRNIKIEISVRDFPNTYKTRNFYGTSINVLQIGDIIAHKLVAIQDRKITANRDIFDSHFFLSSKYATEINNRLIEYRTGTDIYTFYQSLYEFVNKYKPKSALEGLGDLLNERQKNWIRSGRMIFEFKGLIERQIEIYCHTTGT